MFIIVGNGSSVYAVLLDASKAFDRVHYNTLFNKLLDKNIPHHVIRLLLNMYCKQKARIRWCHAHSDYFEVENGVRQGAVLSPILYCIYINDLICRLRESKLGCSIAGTYVGVLCYADDITLIASSCSVLQKMLDICHEFASTHHIEFNADKSEAIRFGQESKDPVNHLVLNGKLIPWKLKIRHLGHLLTCEKDN